MHTRPSDLAVRGPPWNAGCSAHWWACFCNESVISI